MKQPENATKQDLAIIAKIEIKDKQYCPATKEELQVLIKYNDIALDTINTSAITDMSRLFMDAKATKRKDFSGINTWDTSSVTDMSYMFAGCERFNEELGADIPSTSLVGKLLKSSKKSRFITSNVTTMSHMFDGCSDFNKAVKLDTHNVIDMSSMFKDCIEFNSSLDLDTSNVVTMNRMFCACRMFNQALNFNTKSVKDISYMFAWCRSFNQALNFNTENVENFAAFLANATKFNQPFTLNTSKAKKLKNLFISTHFNQPLTLDLSSAEDIENMFKNCSKLTHTPKLENLNNVKSAKGVFENCRALKDIPDMSAYDKEQSKSNEKIELINAKDISILKIGSCESCEDLEAREVDYFYFQFYGAKKLYKNTQEQVLKDIKAAKEPNVVDFIKDEGHYIEGSTDENISVAFINNDYDTIKIVKPKIIQVREDYFVDFDADEDFGNLKDDKDCIGYVAGISSSNKGAVGYTIDENIKEIDPQRLFIFQTLLEECRYAVGVEANSVEVFLPRTLMYLNPENFKKLAIYLAGSEEKAEEVSKEIANASLLDVKLDDYVEVLDTITNDSEIVGAMVAKQMSGYGFSIEEGQCNYGGYFAVGMFDKNRNLLAKSRYMQAFELMDDFSDKCDEFNKQSNAKKAKPSKSTSGEKKYKPTTKDELKELCGDESISLGDIDTSLIDDMSGLFQLLGREDFSGIETWDTSNVTDMSNMFDFCDNFNHPLNFDTSNVTNMNSMFFGCENFNQPLNFDTKNVTDMGNMFFGCEKFNQPLNFDTKNVTDMGSMFANCSSLTYKPNFDMSNVGHDDCMFDGCDSLKDEPNTSNETNASGEKKYKPTTKNELKELCDNEEINLGDIDTSLITDMNSLFQWSDREDFSGIETWNTSKVTNMSYMFKSCKNFNQPLNFDTKNVTNMSYMFAYCSNFNQPLNFDTKNVTDMGSMFNSCENFNQPLNFDTSKVTDMSSMFSGCSNFNQPLNFDTSKVTDMSGMFRGCNNFNQPLNFDISKVTSMREMFKSCKNFNQPLNFDTSKVTDMSGMFRGCNNFNQPLNFDTKNVTNMSSMFNRCENFNQPLNFDTSKVTDMSSMFSGCSNFNQPLNFDTKNVIEMRYMFENCSNLTHKPNFDMSSVEDKDGMFDGCDKLDK